MKNEKGVTISYLVESSSTIDRTNPFKRRIHSNPIILGTRRKFGCNRRAQLLAIAHELRHHQQLSHKSSSKQKHKKWRWTKRIRLSFSRLFRRNDKQWRYENIGTQGCKGARKRTTNFCNKLKGFFKDILGVWQFYKQS
ncbi:uncharacterized protein LOC125817701 [Solanum verrucosum]|uniref:uncharacterized protein LOC125817701 n=1 Tax=Solanum verrucosum TaxID=315347 RepID=UPI0020D0210C|nr:uncharacterized protein LOC125817701 [Solanum verrucosum]